MCMGSSTRGASSIKRLSEGASQLGETRRGRFQERSSGQRSESRAGTREWCHRDAATVSEARRALPDAARASRRRSGSSRRLRGGQRGRQGGAPSPAGGGVERGVVSAVRVGGACRLDRGDAGDGRR